MSVRSHNSSLSFALPERIQIAIALRCTPCTQTKTQHTNASSFKPHAVDLHSISFRFGPTYACLVRVALRLCDRGDRQRLVQPYDWLTSDCCKPSWKMCSASGPENDACVCAERWGTVAERRERCSTFSSRLYAVECGYTFVTVPCDIRTYLQVILYIYIAYPVQSDISQSNLTEH